VGTRRGDPLNQRQVSRHQSKCRLSGLSGLSSRRERFEVWCVWNVACPPEVAPSWSLPTLALRAKVDSSPKFSGSLCYHERCCNWPARCWHQTVARGKMAQYSSWWCPTRSFASIHRRKRNFCPEAVRRPRDILWTHPFVFSRLRMDLFT
jgi:hypothetical protein